MVSFFDNSMLNLIDIYIQWIKIHDISVIRRNLMWLKIRRNSRNEIVGWRLGFSRKLHLPPTQLETSQVPVYLISFWTRSFEASTSVMSSFRVEVVWEVGYDPVSKISVSYVFYRSGILAVFPTSCKADTEDGNETESQTGNSRHRYSVPERYRERDFHEQCASFFVLPVPFYLPFREIFSVLKLVRLFLISSAENPLLIELMLLR